MSVFDLWLPIVVTGIVTHFLCFLAWTVLPHHKPEWKKLAEEDELQDWLDRKGVLAGQYLFPCTHDSAEMKSDAFKAKEAKCRGMLVLWPKPTNMGVNIGFTLVFFFVAAFMIGYLASIALTSETSFKVAFRFIFTAALLTHCAGLFPGVFWFKRQVAMELVDKVAYALATGLIFAGFWG